MQSILREKLLSHALKLGQVSETYRTDSSRFVQAYSQWLDEAEKDLSGLRSPMSVLLQGEKSLLASVSDGYLPPQIEGEKSIRKRQRVIAAQSLEKLSREIYGKIESIDHDFAQFNEKLCHAIAVLASKDPALYGKLEPTPAGISMVWKALGNTPETVPMFNYFCAKLTAPDRDYLLIDIIQKITANKNNS